MSGQSASVEELIPQPLRSSYPLGGRGDPEGPWEVSGLASWAGDLNGWDPSGTFEKSVPSFGTFSRRFRMTAGELGGRGGELFHGSHYAHEIPAVILDGSKGRPLGWCGTAIPRRWGGESEGCSVQQEREVDVRADVVHLLGPYPGLSPIPGFYGGPEFTLEPTQRCLHLRT